MQLNKLSISFMIAVLFHLCALVGILCTPYGDWFIRNTPFNLCLMAALLIWNQPAINRGFLIFFLFAFVAGMAAEITGVHTSRLFGHYRYGKVLGVQVAGVPLVIGLNWFMVISCSGSLLMQMQQWFRKKYEKAGTEMPPKLAEMSIIIDGALLAVFFDWVMEPVAMKLGFWQWENNVVPFYNYFCWFTIGSLLMIAYNRLPFPRPNYFAVHLLIIQGFFFWILRMYL